MNFIKRCITAAVTALTVVATTLSLAAMSNLRILVPANPGGGWDQTGRALQEVMQKNDIVKNVTVENRGGAGGTVGLAQLANARGNPDLLMVGGAVMVGAIITNKSPVTLSQVTPIARLTGEYNVIVVPADSKIKSMKDLVAQLKQNPGGVSWGGGSAGGVDHILVALVAQDAGVDPAKINYIPYSGGGEAIAAIVGGHVTAGVSGYGEFEGQIKAGKMRALAISSEKRIPGIDVPALKEQGVNVELANWRAVFAPPGISDAQRKELVGVIDRTVKSKAWKDLLAQKNWMDVYLAGDEFREYVASEEARIGKILRSVGLAK
jgi:putative tricarboxylic transport membrane protein